jgi:hypothetical protein
VLCFLQRCVFRGWYLGYVTSGGQFCCTTKHEPLQLRYYGFDDRGSIPGRSSLSILVSKQPSVEVKRVSGVLSLLVGRPETKANHSFPSNAEVKNVWNFTCILYRPTFSQLGA